MKNIGRVLAVIFLIAALTGCDKKSVPEPNDNQIVENAVNRVRNDKLTLGNHTYVLLNIEGKPINYVNEILITLKAFEKIYPELKITNWHIDRDQYNSRNIYGLWIDHEPRTR